VSKRVESSTIDFDRGIRWIGIKNTDSFSLERRVRKKRSCLLVSSIGGTAQGVRARDHEDSTRNKFGENGERRGEHRCVELEDLY